MSRGEGGDGEKRAFERFLLQVPLYVSLPDRVYRKKLSLQSRDVSGGGLSFVTREKLPIDARSRVVVAELGDFLGSAHIEGTVVYIRRLGAGKGYTVGIEFTKFVDVDREALIERLKQWEAAAGKRAPQPSAAR